MAPSRDYRKPKNNEMRDLLVLLPHPVRVLDGSGKLLWQNQAAERSDSQTHWIQSPTTWQGQKAVLCMPHLVEDKPDPTIAELEAENERLRKHQRSTARRKKQAEETIEKVVGDVSKREQKLKEQLESAELRVRELEASLEASFEGSVEFSAEGSKGKRKSKAKSKAKSKSKKGTSQSQEIAVPASFEAELRQLEQAQSGLRADLAALQAAETRWKEDKRHLEAAKRALDDENHQIREEIRKLKDEHRHLEEVHSQLKSAHHELKESYDTLDEAHSNLKEAHQSLEVAHGQLHQELEETRGGQGQDLEELKELRAAKAQLEEDKIQLESWVEELESARRSGEEGSERAEHTLSQARAEAQDLTEQAELLLEKAQMQAVAIVQEAEAQTRAQAQQLAEQARQQGYEDGLKAGQLEATDQRLDDLAAKLEDAEKLNAELKTEYEHYKEQVEREEALREPDAQLAERVRQFEEIERAYEEQQNALRAQKEELEQRLTEQEEEFTRLRDSLRSQAAEKADIAPRELEELKADLEEAKMAIAESAKREVRLSDRLEAAAAVKEEQSKVLALLKEELEGFREREKELRETTKLLENFRDQARSEAKKFKAEADEAREANEKLEARLLESRRELAEARSAGPLSKGISLREVSSAAGSSGEAASPTIKNQLEFAQNRLRETEKQLDEAREALKKARSEAISAKDTEKLAFQDALTGLPNRHIVDRYLDFSHKQARSGNRAYSLFLIDIDGFRVLNQTFGRDFGDSLLKAVGERLAGMRGANHIIARHNEDRFLLLAADLEKRAADKFIEDASRSLLGALSHPFEVKGEQIKLTGSIGIALGPGASEDPREMFQQAEIALNSAKAHGSGSYFVHNEALLQKAQREATYQRQMEHAISRDEFSAKYQPIFNLNKGLTMGVELFLRWNHRDQRVLRPEEFLEVATRSGLIFAIADAIWPKAFRALARWRKLRPGVTLSINLSDRELLSPKLVERASAMAKAAGVEPSAILFEVRDASRLRMSGTWWTVLGALHGAGFGLVLDDYAGEASMFSTLAYSGFVVAKTTIDEKNPICTPSPSAAKGVQYCAKKVQTKFDPKALKKAGFDMAQGFAVGQLLEESAVDGIL